MLPCGDFLPESLDAEAGFRPDEGRPQKKAPVARSLVFRLGYKRDESSRSTDRLQATPPPCPRRSYRRERGRCLVHDDSFRTDRRRMPDAMRGSERNRRRAVLFVWRSLYHKKVGGCARTPRAGDAAASQAGCGPVDPSRARARRKSLPRPTNTQAQARRESVGFLQRTMTGDVRCVDDPCRPGNGTVAFSTLTCRVLKRGL